MLAVISTVYPPGYNSDVLNTTESANVDYTSVNESTTLLDVLFNDSCNCTTLLPTESVYFPAIPEKDVKAFSYITRSFINPCLGIIGFIGNIMGVGVLWRQARQHKLSIFWYLCALTIFDILFLALAMVDAIPRLVGAFDKELSKYLIPHFRTGLTFIDNALLHTARYIVVIMSCDRLIAVARPLHVKDSCLSRHPLRVVIGCLIFNLIVASPLAIFSTVKTIQKNNATEYVFTFRNLETFVKHWWVAEAIIHSFIPMLLLVPLNIAIPLKFYRATRRMRQYRSEGSYQQGKVTATVIAITLMYIILSIPMMVMKLLQYINPEFNVQGKHRLYFWFMHDVIKCLAYINAAADFVMYFLVSNNYRVVFKSMYCRVCSKRQTNDKPYPLETLCMESRDTLYTIT